MRTLRKLAATITTATLAAGLAVPAASASSHGTPPPRSTDWCVSGTVQDTPTGRALAEAVGASVGDTVIVCDGHASGWDVERADAALNGGTARHCFTPDPGDYYVRQYRLVRLSGPATALVQTGWVNPDAPAYDRQPLRETIAIDYPFYEPWTDEIRLKANGQINRGSNRGTVKRARNESCAGDNPPAVIPAEDSRYWRADPIPGTVVYEWRQVFANDGYTRWLARGLCTTPATGSRRGPVVDGQLTPGDPIPDDSAVTHRYACDSEGRSAAEIRRNPEGYLAVTDPFRSNEDGRAAAREAELTWAVILRGVTVTGGS